MAGTIYGTFDDLLEVTPDQLKPILAALRSRILEIEPEAVETVRPGERAATYGVGERKNTEGYIYLMPHKDWVNLGFYQGVSLPDPEALLEGTGKKLRHVKIRDARQVDDLAVGDLIRAAAAERRGTLGL